MARPARSRTAPPQLDRLELADLPAGDPAELAPGGDVEGAWFASVDEGGADLAGARLDGVRVDELRAGELDLSGTRFSEVVAERVEAPVVRAARSRWRDVRLGGRLGSVEAYDAEWRGVHLVGAKIGYLNLRGADLTDVLFTDCQVTELDLLGTTARRVAFVGTSVASLTVQDARLSDVDLRGAELETVTGVRHLAGVTVDGAQLTLMAPLLAAELGLRVEERAAPRR